MRNIRIGDYVGNERYEVYIGGDKRIWYEINLRYFINRHINNNIYRSYNYDSVNRHIIANFLTVLVLLGVDI